MAALSSETQKLRKRVLVGLTLGITAVFLWMIREFVVPLILAAVISSIFYPLYRNLRTRFRGHQALASGATLAVILLVVVVPLVGFLGLVASQALHLSKIAQPWVQEQLQHQTALSDLFERYPELDRLAPYRNDILSKAGELVGRLGSFMVTAVTAVARETATFLFLLFVTLYAIFFFLIDGRVLLSKILYYLPLAAEDESRMVDRFLSVSRATLKGTLVIGILQGALGGVAFWVAGIGAPALWAAVMAVLSIVPGVGSALVWLPACVYLAIVGRWLPAGLLFAWCAGIVGSVDNFLRPALVGKDTKMPDLLILLATLGGIVLFGALGFVIGPIIAALFVTAWDLYGEAFSDLLPPVDPVSRPPDTPPPIGEHG